MSINLLPWRDMQKRRRRRRRQIICLLGTALGIALLVGFRFFVLLMNHRLDLPLQILKNETQQFTLPVLAYPKNVIDRDLAMIKKIKSHHQTMLAVFMAIGKTLPIRCQLLTLEQQKDTITLSGRCQSSSFLFSYLQRLNQISGLQAVVLQNVHSGRDVFFSAQGKLFYENKNI